MRLSKTSLLICVLLTQKAVDAYVKTGKISNRRLKGNAEDTMEFLFCKNGSSLSGVLWWLRIQQQ